MQLNEFVSQVPKELKSCKWYKYIVQAIDICKNNDLNRAVLADKILTGDFTELWACRYSKYIRSTMVLDDNAPEIYVPEEEIANEI